MFPKTTLSREYETLCDDISIDTQRVVNHVNRGAEMYQELEGRIETARGNIFNDSHQSSTERNALRNSHRGGVGRPVVTAQSVAESLRNEAELLAMLDSESAATSNTKEKGKSKGKNKKKR